MKTAGVITHDVTLASAASQLAGKLTLPLVEPDQSCDFLLLLKVSDEGLSLVPCDRHLGKALKIDFVKGATAYRRLAAGSTQQPLAKAIGLRKDRPYVFDATAGLGRDAFLLACWGCRVTAVERSPILAAMLGDALNRALAVGNSKLAAIVQRITVVSGDSKRILSDIHEADRPEVIYLDPMYTPSGSSALAKKEMRILRMLVGGDEDADALLRVARRIARKRVIVKRHLRAPELAEGITMSHRGRSVRYDVYVMAEPRA